MQGNKGHIFSIAYEPSVTPFSWITELSELDPVVP